MSDAIVEGWDEEAPAIGLEPLAPIDTASASIIEPDLPIASSLAEVEAKYEIGKAIGKGKFSTVYRATRRADGLPVALKQIHVFDVMDDRSRAKCKKEIKMVQTVQHENIIRYLDGFAFEKQVILVFEFAEAGDLKRQLRKAREKEARFDERVIWKYFCQIVAAVAHMHQKRIMHRDLKPANIFLTLDGTIKVGDFGLGRILSDNTLKAHSKVGTPLYMSPEVLQGKGYGWSSDIWSLGCILYELAMLRSPFKEDGLNLYGLFQKITKGEYPPISTVYSSELRDLVTSMLDLKPDLRPSIEDVLKTAIEMRDVTTRARLEAGIASASDKAAAPPPSSASALPRTNSAGAEAPAAVVEKAHGTTEATRTSRPMSATHKRRSVAPTTTAASAAGEAEGKADTASFPEGLRVRTEPEPDKGAGNVLFSPALPLSAHLQASPMDSPDLVVPYTAIMEVAEKHKQQVVGGSKGATVTTTQRAEDAPPSNAPVAATTKPPRHAALDRIAITQPSRPDSATSAVPPGSPSVMSSSAWSLPAWLEMCDGAQGCINSTLVDVCWLLQAQKMSSSAPACPREMLQDRVYFVAGQEVAAPTTTRFSVLLKACVYFSSYFAASTCQKLQNVHRSAVEGATPFVSAAEVLLNEALNLDRKMLAEHLDPAVCSPMTLSQAMGAAALKVLSVFAFYAFVTVKPAFHLPHVEELSDAEEVGDSDSVTDADLIMPDAGADDDDLAVVAGKRNAAVTVEADDIVTAVSATEWLKEYNRVKSRLTAVDSKAASVDTPPAATAAAAYSSTTWRARMAALEHAHANVCAPERTSSLQRLEGVSLLCHEALERLNSTEQRLMQMTLSGGKKMLAVSKDIADLQLQQQNLQTSIAATQARIVECTSSLNDILEDVESTQEAIANKNSEYTGTERLQRIRKSLVTLRNENQLIEMQLGIVRRAVIHRQMEPLFQQHRERADSDDEAPA